MGVLASCEDAPIDDVVKLPENLAIEIVKSESNPRVVSVNASADLVNFYRFYFGENPDDFKESTSGTAQYTYEQSGQYEITVQAHATSDDFISETGDIEIQDVNPEDEEDPEDPFEPSFEGYESPLEYEGYELVWQDEFEAEQLSDDYTFEIGTGSNGWGNNESQYYREENTRLDEGYLVIQAKEENFQGREYTSSRIITEGKKEFKYGRFDIRARMPYGQGIWPAIWMLGSNFRQVGWPFCGEIDIMEMIGGQGRERTVHGTVHWQSNQGYANFGHSRNLSEGTLADKFHVFSIIWDENSIQWLIDDQPYGSIDTTPSHLDEFREEFFFIFNVAVGGNWPQYPDETTTFPQEMWIDYVRVFQQPE
ncbi:glycoside hydrolase family 16 protein [Marivirga harenae]|uniref:glycoside hydrolase family 16 protein n=1 Tax=Marivirga harenae TaxID=2010992 RepID=UPI0026DFA082|nr:glycoside hydrolase family 16 protein [Marivirga harenae]WKV11189.1 glycoside hydrolase family 16 protein [Marivirga harenae]|tara:strand:+ start:66521 stop:67618 length:1098 start_codon:yes stop_codon:yes gene_type:complete